MRRFLRSLSDERSKKEEKNTEKQTLMIGTRLTIFPTVGRWKILLKGFFAFMFIFSFSNAHQKHSQAVFRNWSCPLHLSDHLQLIIMWPVGLCSTVPWSPSAPNILTRDLLGLADWMGPTAIFFCGKPRAETGGLEAPATPCRLSRQGAGLLPGLSIWDVSSICHFPPQLYFNLHTPMLEE